MTTETHGLKFVVDTSDVQKGFRDYKSAVEGVFGSLDKFEAYVAKTMKNVASAASNKEALSAFKNAVNGFSDIKIDASAAKNITALANAMKGFRAPGADQSANVKRFLSSLQGLPDLTAAYRTIKSIDDLNIAMRGFKAPPEAQAQNLLKFAKTIQSAVPMLNSLGGTKSVSSSISQISSLSAVMARLKPPTAGQITNLGNFAKALQNFKFGNLSGSGNFFATLASIGQFKAPSATQVKNLTNFTDAVSKIKVPTNGGPIATYLQQISTAAGAANGAMVKFRGGVGQASSGFSAFTSGAHGSRLEMMGLQNAFSGTFQAGSLLRSLLGSLTIGEVGRQFFEAAQMVNQFRASMEVVNQTAGFNEVMWKQVSATANKFGADLPTYAEGFAKFAAAAHESGMSVAETTKVYEGFQTVMTGLHLGTEQQQSVGLAIREIMDRGYVSTQQLTRQLGLVLPGALATLKTAWAESGKPGISLFDALKKKMVDGQWALDVLAQHYKEAYGPALTQALQSPTQQFNILKNNITQMMIAIGDTGATKAFANIISQVSGYLDPKNVKNFTDAIGQGLTSAVNKASSALAWLHDNWDSIKGPLSTALKLMGQWMVVSAGFQISRSLVSPLISLYGTMNQVNGVLSSGSLASGKLAGGFTALTTGLVPLTTAYKSYNIVAGLASLTLTAIFAPINLARGAYLAMSGVVASTATVFTASSLAARASALGLGLLNLSLNTLRIGFNAAKIAGAAFVGILNAFAPLAIITGLFAIGQGVMSVESSLKSTQPMLDGVNKDLTELGLRELDSAKCAATLAGSHQDAITPIKNFAGEVGAAADALYRMADAQKKATLSKIIDDENKVIGDYNEQHKYASDNHDARDAYRNRGGLSRIAAPLGIAAYRGGVMAGSYLWNGTDVRGEANTNEAKDRSALAQLHQRFAEANKPVEQYVTPAMRAATGNTGTLNPIYSGADEKPTKAKPDKELAAFKQFENGFESLMSKLDANDPIAKINDEWTRTLTGAAELLLNKSGLKGAMETIGDVTESSHDKVTALIDELKSGHVSTSTANYLQKYNMSVTDLVDKLQAGEDANEQKIRDAIVKKETDKYKKMDVALAKIGDVSPTRKLDLENASDLRSQASTFLTAGTPEQQKGITDYIESLQQLKNGTMTVQQATDALSQKLRAQGGISIQVADAVDQYGRAQAYAHQQAELEAQFGGKIIDQKKQELLLTSQSARDQRVLNDLESAVQDARTKGMKISQQEISDLRTKLELNDKLLQAEKARMEWVANNGVKAYINGVQQAGDAINNLDKNFLQSIEDQLVSLGKTGKFSFSTIFETIQDGLLKFSAGQVMKTILGPPVGDGDTPTIFGKIIPGYQAPTPITNQDKSGRRMTVSANTGKLTPDEQVQALNDATAKDLTTKFQTQNTDVANNFSTAITATFQPLAESFQTTLATAITAAGGKAGSLPAIGAGGSTAANDNNLIDQWSKIKLTPDHIALPDLSKTTSTLVSDPQQQDADKQIARNATTFGTAMQSIMPMVALSFGNAFKSPIAQIAATFGTMIIEKLLTSQSGSSVGGIGGLFSKIFKGGGGGGGDAGLAEELSEFGGAKEGGIVGSFVNSYSVKPSAFANAPHYSEGTPNTSGGIPSILHDNEAVIPLSRGRKVPVELNGMVMNAGAGAPTPQINMPNVNVAVHNYGDSKPTVQQSSNPDGSLNLDIIIEQVENRIAGNVNKGGSPMNSAIEKRYNVSAAQGNFR